MAATTTAAKKTSSKTAKVEKAPRARKEGLRAPQVRILAFLKKTGKAASRAMIAEKAPVDTACCVEYIGSTDAETRKANDDRKGFKSLLTLCYVRVVPTEEGQQGTWYVITPNGVKGLAKAEAAE